MHRIGRLVWLMLVLATPALAQTLGTGDLSNGTTQATGSTTPRKLSDRAADTLNVKDFGAKGDGVADDTLAVQAAINASANRTLYLGTHLYKITSPLTAPSPITILGALSNGGIYNGQCTTGLVAGAVNLNMLTLQGNNSRIRDVCFQMSAARTLNQNTAGAAITIGATLDTVVEGNQFNYPFIAVDVSGVGTSQNLATLVQNNTVVNPTTTGAAFRIGANSTGGNTVDMRIYNNNVACNYTPSQAVGTLFLDAGGPMLAGNDIYNCGMGMKIYPGAGQHVEYMYAHDLIGDTSQVNDLFIDTASSTGTVRTLSFLGTWTSSVDKNGVVIQNTAGGQVNNIRFVAHRALMGGTGSGSAFYLVSGDMISIRDSQICSNIDAPSKVGINLLPAATHVSIQNNAFSVCLGTIGIGVNVVDGNSTGFQLTGNDLNGVTTPLIYHPNNENTIIGNNWGIDSGISNIASASTITLPLSPIVRVTGAVPVGVINGSWFDRTLKLVSVDGGLSLTKVANGVCVATTLAQGATATLTWDTTLGCWLVG